ncbi:MAG TPA: endonuclease/exonuclease/phosphatase family protein [Ktedonobacterales bacterium]|nr:endonuclease/exonuclease/phosphatase family protein [Ktedonobacterales bacterium]
MTRVYSYNILAGGTCRVDPLAKMLQSRNVDLVGLVEAVDEQVVAELAARLGMEYRLSGRLKGQRVEQGALLSRLPILATTAYRSSVLTKQPLLEVRVEEPDGQSLTVFVAHLTASFSQGWAAAQKRRREVAEILRIMASHQGTNHLLMGDFNSIAPGERVKGSQFLRYMTDPDLYYHLASGGGTLGLPNLNYVVPPALGFVKPVLRAAPKSKLLGSLFDAGDALYAPRGGFDLLRRAGYVDCFRALHPSEPGFTWPAGLAAGRIDYIFASSTLAARLAASAVETGSADVNGADASDHLPVFAEFG